jgi:hypothetical protein
LSRYLVGLCGRREAGIKRMARRVCNARKESQEAETRREEGASKGG